MDENSYEFIVHVLDTAVERGNIPDINFVYCRVLEVILEHAEDPTKHRDVFLHSLRVVSERYQWYDARFCANTKHKLYSAFSLLTKVYSFEIAFGLVKGDARKYWNMTVRDNEQGQLISMMEEVD